MKNFNSNFNPIKGLYESIMNNDRNTLIFFIIIIIFHWPVATSLNLISWKLGSARNFTLETKSTFGACTSNR